MLFFTEVARRYLPYPAALKVALARGQVDITRTAGQTAYIISLQCHNVEEVAAAIHRRNGWVRAVADIEGTALLSAIALILYLTAHL